MRILMLSKDYLPPFRPDVAKLFGVELHALGLKTDLLGQVMVDRKLQSTDWPAGRIHASGRQGFGLLSDALRPVWDLALVRHLSRHHDLLQVRDKIRTGLIGLAWARLRGCRFSYWMSFPMVEGFELRATQERSSPHRLRALLFALRARVAARVFYRWLAPRVDHLFVQSEAMLEHMARRGVARERMTAVPMGVDLAQLAQVQAQPAAVPTLVYLGTLARARDPLFLLEVLAQVRRHRPEVRLLLVGDAPSPDEQRWLRDSIAQHPQADAVRLTGWLPQEQALALVAGAQIGLSPIPRGPLFDVSSPTKAIEYLGLGLPCVGNDIPDQQLVLERSAAGLCVPLQADAFADACLQLLADPARAADMGRQGRAWAAAHRDYRVLAAQVFEVYRRLLGVSSDASSAAPIPLDPKP